MKLEGTRFVMSPGGSALGLPAGEYWAVPDAALREAQERVAELERQLVARDQAEEREAKLELEQKDGKS